MHTPRRRNSSATGAFFFFALACLLLLPSAGCTTFRHGETASPPPGAEPVLLAPRHLEIGRILSYDPTDVTAVIEFVPHYRSAVSLAGTSLISRKLDTLEPTARLIASPHQNADTLGAYVTSGQPSPDDEVVIAPESALPSRP
jgi:hypothetical protein